MTQDAGDSGTTPFDGGPDGGTPPDAGRIDGGPRADAGFSDPNTIQEGEEEIAGLRTYVHLMGTLTSTLPPVLFLHDGPHLAHEYLPAQMSFLLPGRLLAFYDMRATGRTSFGTTTMTATLSADRHALDVADFAAWLEMRSGKSRFDLIGHGYGAGVASLFAADHPERVERLVLVTPFPADALQLANYNAEALSRLSSSERAFINALTMEPECWGNVNMCTIEIWGIQGPHFMCEANQDQFRMMTFMFGDYRTKEKVEFGLRDGEYDWRGRLSMISVPTTIISGPCDPTPPEVALTYTASIAGARHFILDQSGHFPFVEETAEFQQIVKEALRR
jgi:proline iminopeptidase